MNEREEVNRVEEEAEDEVKLTEEELNDLIGEARNYKISGNEYYVLGTEDGNLKAIEYYTKAIDMSTALEADFSEDVAIFFCNRAAVYLRQNEYKLIIEDCNKAIELNPKYIKAYIRRAQAKEKDAKYDQALKDWEKVYELDSTQILAINAMKRLPPLITKQQEEMKTEMLGKLKDLGNTVLGKFGLSTDNFQMQKDPNSGGYSIQFNKNQ